MFFALSLFKKRLLVLKYEWCCWVLTYLRIMSTTIASQQLVVNILFWERSRHVRTARAPVRNWGTVLKKLRPGSEWRWAAVGAGRGTGGCGVVTSTLCVPGHLERGVLSITHSNERENGGRDLFCSSCGDNEGFEGSLSSLTRDNWKINSSFFTLFY